MDTLEVARANTGDETWCRHNLTSASCLPSAAAAAATEVSSVLNSLQATPAG